MTPGRAVGHKFVGSPATCRCGIRQTAVRAVTRLGADHICAAWTQDRLDAGFRQEEINALTDVLTRHRPGPKTSPEHRAAWKANLASAIVRDSEWRR